MKETIHVGLLGLAALSCVLCGTFIEAAGSGKPLDDLTGSWQLFVDDALVAEKSGVARKYHSFERSAQNPVLVPDKPWEDRCVFLYGTVLPAAAGGYRMWYHAADVEYRNLYATSKDGIHWDKPDLGLVEYQGSRKNNILFRRTKEDHLPQVIHTPWDPDPQRHYKLMNYDYGRTKPDHLVSGFYGAFSSDGIHWKQVARNPVLVDPGDVGNFNWDPHTRQYIGYPKTFAPVRGYRRRCIGFARTADFEKWPPAELILVPDEFDDRWVSSDKQHTDFYGLSGFAYEAGYLGFLWIFRITDGDDDGPIFAELVSSRDGVNWVREEGERQPILSVGKQGAWDGGMVYTSNHPLVEGATIKLYYGGFTATHSAQRQEAAIGLATLRKDGFASLDAGAEPGIVTTRRLKNTHGELRVNANASSGWLKVEVLDASGKVVPGYGRNQCTPVEADGINQKVVWGPRTVLPGSGSVVQLRFVMSNASLYSFIAGENVNLADVAGPADIFLTFEGNDVGTRSQDAVYRNSVAVVDDKDNAAEGTSAVRFGGQGLTLDTLEIPATFHLGNEFTLAAMVKSPNEKLTRLFSTYRGSGAPATGELLFDFNPNSGVLRFTVNGQTVQSEPRFFADKLYHHFAATYDHGTVKLYLDGLSVGAGEIRRGAAHLCYDRSVVNLFGAPGSRSVVGIHLADNLRVGGDVGGRFITYHDAVVGPTDEQLAGYVDDILVARRVLAGKEIKALSERGGVSSR